MSQELYDELRALVGGESAVVDRPDEVCKQMIRHWCEAMEDANPVYTDEEYARRTKFGGIIAPPTMIQAWCFPPLWPAGQELQWRDPEVYAKGQPPVPHQVALEKLAKAGCTGVFAARTVMEFVQPLFPGDRVNLAIKLVDVTPERETRAGKGHFVTFVNTYTNQRDELVGTQAFTVLAFRPKEE